MREQVVTEVPSDEAPWAPSPEELAPLFPQLAIETRLGRGGMGAVYRVRQIELDRDVALKILLLDASSDDPTFAERFRREARALAALSHAGIVHVHDSGQAGGWFYFLMEYVDGSSLRQLVQDGPVEPARALAIVRQVCDALAYAHERGVVHRDIKPENVLIGRAGEVKLVDFGLARLLGPARPEHTLTRTGQAMGTPHYMAPEQWRDPERVDHRADIYSLGVVFHELLTREVPLGRFAPPSRKVPVTARLDEIVLKAIDSDPERRYQSATDLAADLDAVAEAEVRPSASPTGVRAAAREATGFVATVMKAGWLLGVAIFVGAGSWGLRAIMLARGSVDPDRGAVTDVVATCLGVMGFGVALAAVSRSRLVRREKALGIDPVPTSLERAWMLPSTALIGCAELIYAANATQDTALTESMWISAMLLLLLCGVTWGITSIERGWRARARS